MSADSVSLHLMKLFKQCFAPDIDLSDLHQLLHSHFHFDYPSYQYSCYQKHTLLEVIISLILSAPIRLSPGLKSILNVMVLQVDESQKNQFMRELEEIASTVAKPHPNQESLADVFADCRNKAVRNCSHWDVALEAMEVTLKEYYESLKHAVDTLGYRILADKGYRRNNENVWAALSRERAISFRRGCLDSG